MKKIAGLLIILVVLVLGGYYFMGRVTEKTINNNITVLNRSQDLTLSLAEYHRGWFVSNALLSWKIHVPERTIKSADGQSQQVPAQDIQDSMKIKIYHGPIIFANKSIKFGLGYAKTDVNMPPQYDEQFKNAFTAESVKPKLDLSLFINYFNQSKLNMSVPTFKLIAKEGDAQFFWMGLDSNVTISSSNDNIDGDLTLDGMRVSKENIHADVGVIETEYKLHKASNGMLLGDINLSFPSLYWLKKKRQLYLS